jgi:hypothetical protein
MARRREYGEVREWVVYESLSPKPTDTFFFLLRHGKAQYEPRRKFTQAWSRFLGFLGMNFMYSKQKNPGKATFLPPNPISLSACATTLHVSGIIAMNTIP